MLKKFLLLILFLLVNLNCKSQQLAFPSAAGFGRHATGGRGGLIYKVTNLNDDGEGSLRKGILKKGPRIIVFDVSGTIVLKSKLDVNHGDLTILGQTAPGAGITIIGYPFTIKADNIIIRYLRFRMGDVNKVEGDALGCRYTRNVIIDHCSISWATDENASCYDNENFTMQWCIISEALNNSVHHKGPHGYGGIWGGVKASFHHNLIVSNNSRNPRFSGSSTTQNAPDEFVDFRNNVIYNWGENSIYGGERGSYNLVNNYFKSGPATTDSKKDRIIGPTRPYGKFYVAGNFVYGYPEITKNNWNGGVQCDSLQAIRLREPVFNFENTPTLVAEQAFKNVLRYAGMVRFRDSVDKRIINDTEHGSTTYKNGIIDSQNDVGGWPVLKLEKAAPDADGDGIPDSWEKEHSLNINENDAAMFTLSDTYTNIEVYANSLVQEIAENEYK